MQVCAARPRYVTQEERENLCGQPCTLDGKPAIIGGLKQRFAIVYQLGTGIQYSWAWPTVWAIMQGNKAFRS